MLQINSLLQNLVCLDATTLRRLAVIVSAILTMTGRVTMLGISRWAEEGGSYRSIQRFFLTDINWDELHWQFIKYAFFDIKDIYIIAGDEVITSKSGTETYGLDKFYSSIIGKVIPSLSFFTFSLISTTTATSYPLMTRQIIRPETAPTETVKPEKRGKGRPKGSKNKNKAEVELSWYFQFIGEMLKTLLLLSGLDVRYFVFDGAFGTNYALQMVKKCGSHLHLISKLQCNSALYFPNTEPYGGRGAPRKYGTKLDYKHLPTDYLKKSSIEDGLQTAIYQMNLLHENFPQLLNVVIMVKTNLQTGKSAQVILFSSDLTLSYDNLIAYYRLRFQIEFNFRDAKQFWGLEDFMNIKKTPVTNAANLSFFMVNVAQALLRQYRQENPKFSVNDLKAHFRGLKYATEVLKLLPEKPAPILIDLIFSQLTTLGAINTP